MERRNFIKNAAGVGALGLMTPASLSAFPNGAQIAAEDDRTYWVNLLVKIADPVLTNLAAGTLKKNMPVECKEGQEASGYM